MIVKYDFKVFFILNIFSAVTAARIVRYMTIISKAFITAASFLAAGTVYSESGFALNSESNNIDASDIFIDAELINVSPEELTQKQTGENIIFVDGTGNFEQEIPKQVNPEIGTAEYEEAQEAAEAAALEAENNKTASSLKELVKQQNTSGALSEEMQCLAGTVYFESKGESLDGQLAVAKVVLERVASSRFPNTICDVVYQRRQFSFVRRGRMPKISKGRKTWRNAVAIAKIATEGLWESKVEGALFFHATYVSPGWKLKRIGRIDKHIFYR